MNAQSKLTLWKPTHARLLALTATAVLVTSIVGGVAHGCDSGLPDPGFEIVQDRTAMQRRIASINDLAIDTSERKFRWSQGRRPDGHHSLSDLGL